MNVAEVAEDVVRERLRTEDPEFQKLEQEHRRLDKELMNFETHVYLSPEEEVERRRLQKLKLAAKDKMTDMIRRRRTGNA
ncbi:MAG: YdcH family protein [Nitrospirota bacterium]|nr:YdcH family protein [Nitrospirota bacterium]